MCNMSVPFNFMKKNLYETKVDIFLVRPTGEKTQQQAEALL